jgi:hypothetical protein
MNYRHGHREKQKESPHQEANHWDAEDTEKINKISVPSAPLWLDLTPSGYQPWGCEDTEKNRKNLLLVWFVAKGRGWL